MGHVYDDAPHAQALTETQLRVTAGNFEETAA